METQGQPEGQEGYQESVVSTGDVVSMMREGQLCLRLWRGQDES